MTRGARGTTSCSKADARARLNGSDHKAAVRLLALVDGELANALGRALNLKTRAAYGSQDTPDGDAKACVRAARRLRDAARDAVFSNG
jgi:hypothetical protein